MKRLSIVSVLLLCACQETGTSPMPEDATAEPEKPREIRLTSEDGLQELALTPSGISITREGKSRVEIAAGETTTTIVLRDTGGRQRAQLLVTDGVVGVSLFDPAQHNAAVIAVNETDSLSRMELFGSGQEPRAGLAVRRDGRGSMTMIGAAQPTPTPVMPAASPTP